MKKYHFLPLFSCFFLSLSCATVPEPEPVGPLPSERQLAWHELEYYGFIHFNMTTFTNMEWGGGDESPETFNPTELDTRQWAKVAKEAGMKGIIITAKHHDGFSIWPTETSEHSVKNSPWKDGQGDVLKELAEACKEYGLKFGVYLSPWDRNHPEYGREEYVDEVFLKQLEELLTNYGPIFEVWFDGANGGTGYYGGANENRKIDHRSYYKWDKVIAMVREHQPDAVIFGDNGPDVRWIGNEHGIAGETNWSIIRKDEMYAGSGRHKELQFGHEDGTHWVAGEADVSIRPGWYYHPEEDHLVKSLPQLLDIYYGSVGRNASLLLNLPVDRRGLVHEKDVEQLMKLRNKLDEDFETNLAVNINVEASGVRGDASDYKAGNTVDADAETYWAPEIDTIKSSLTLDFGQETTFNRFLVQEYIRLGQRVKAWNLEAWIDGQWLPIEEQTTIGYKRILRFDPVTTSKLRFNILDAKASPLISNIEVYNAPPLLVAPEIQRNREGEISIGVPDDNVEIFYSLDGSDPTLDSEAYSGTLNGQQPVIVKAVAYDPKAEEYSSVTTVSFDIPKGRWKVSEISSGNSDEVSRIMDEDHLSWWHTERDQGLPQEVVIDLGQAYSLEGFTYSPPQDRWSFGIIAEYEFQVSANGKNWRSVSSGEFGNIKNNPIKQTIEFNPVQGRYIKLKALRTTDESGAMAIGELGVITSEKKE